MSTEKEALGVFGPQTIAFQPCSGWFCCMLRLENHCYKENENPGLLARITEHRVLSVFHYGGHSSKVQHKFRLGYFGKC